MNKLFEFSKLYSVYKVFYEVLSKSQSRQQSMVRSLFIRPTAGEFGDTSRQTISNQTGRVSLRLSDFSKADAGKLFTRGDYRRQPLKFIFSVSALIKTF